jgi:hypothetical protein
MFHLQPPTYNLPYAKFHLTLSPGENNNFTEFKELSPFPKNNKTQILNV